MEYYIYITNDCNMNCQYCSVLFDTQIKKIPLTPNYSFLDLKIFIVKTQKQLKEKVADIYFFGGEPTLNYTIIEQLIYELESIEDNEVNFIMHTNGLLIPNSPPDVLKKLKLMLLSFNYELMFENNLLTPYFVKMINTIEHVRLLHSIPIIGRITVSPMTSLFTEACIISNFVDYVYWQIDNNITELKFEAYSRHYKYEIQMLLKYWITCMEKGIFIRFVPFISAVRNIINEPEVPQNFYCGYGKSMIYIQTDGTCYACCDNVCEKSHYIGSIYDGIQFAHNEIKNTMCKDCSYVKLCGGRCGRMHKDFSYSHAQKYCELNKYMFDLIISEIDTITDLLNKHSDFNQKIFDPMLSYTEYTA